MRVNHYLAPGLIMLTIAASWPHWVWLARRANDGSDDPWGLVALLTLAALFWLDKDKLRLPWTGNLAISALLTMAGCLSSDRLPPIVGAAFAISGVIFLVWSMLPSKRPLPPILALAILSLPLVASLNFYLGYPLRWLCALASAQTLSLLGLDVSPEGASLLWNGKTILIDAPCAGIAMLWVGMYLAALFSYLNQAGWLRTLTNLTMALIVVITGNILRNTLLFYKEAGIVHLPHWTHEAIGLLVFGVLLALIYLVTHKGVSHEAS